MSPDQVVTVESQGSLFSEEMRTRNALLSTTHLFISIMLFPKDLPQECQTDNKQTTLVVTTIMIDTCISKERNSL